MRNSLRWLAIVLVFVSCKPSEDPPRLFELVRNTGIDFANHIQNTADFNIFSYRNFYNGGGVAIGDINNDSLPDIFLTANMGANKLYLNKGNWKFEDITEKAGIRNRGKWGTGVVFTDINADGWLDMYVCYAGYQKGIGNENELYINNRNGSFTESAAQYGLNESGYTTHAAFFDYDLDGDLDCYVLKNSFIPVNTLNYANKRNLRAEDWPVADFLKGGGDKLLRNDNGRFADVSKEANIYGSLIGFGLGVTVGDVNGDHFPDLYISNDFFERDYLYINQKNGTFKEDLEQCMQHISLSSMGADIADVNNDGYPDIFTTDMLPADDRRLKTTTSFESIDVKNLKLHSGFFNQYTQNTLQINNRNGRFLETAFYSGVAASDWSWGGLIFDADNDGLSDLFVCNGIYHDVTDQDFIEFFANDVVQKLAMTGKKEEVDDVIRKMPSTPIPNMAFRNLGNLKFKNEASSWGLDQPSFSSGAAYGDLDNDGDLDLVVNNVNQKAFVYRNNSREQLNANFIAIQLQGTRHNSFAVGSIVRVFQKGQVLTRELIPSRGFQSSVDYKIVIGLGKGKVDSLQVIWPDRTYVVVHGPAVNMTHVIKQSEADKKIITGTPVWTPLFDSVKHLFQKHEEDPFVDFYYERGMPMMLSHEGPKAAYGDVNGDGWPDVYICGAARQPGQLYLQTKNGFVKKAQASFHRFAEREGVTALFFDADNDRDLDLAVGYGGNRFPSGNATYRSVLYVNDGKGNFTANENAFPANGMNTSCMLSNDYDKDGDLDVFVGSRSVPHNYGTPAPGFVYRNDGRGKFEDVTATVFPQAKTLGLVTSAIWTDVNNDEQDELIVAGEWMPPRVFQVQNGRFGEMQTTLKELNGWWKTVEASDLDNDGDQDLVLGNLGENFYFSPTQEKPVKMFVKDFDGNGSVEKIMTRTIDGKDKPLFLKKELTDQIASLRKQNLKYVDYADKSVYELFTAGQLKGAQQSVFSFPSSIIAWNEGNGKFTVQKLPLPVQLSCVNAIAIADINDDGSPDLLLAGNEFNFLPQFSQLDASYGHVLLNRGNRSFEVVEKSGLDIRGEVKDILDVSSSTVRRFLFLQNNRYPVLYHVRQSSNKK